MDTSQEFKFARDFSKIDWKSTLRLKLIRAACAGPVFGILALLIERSLTRLRLRPTSDMCALAAVGAAVGARQGSCRFIHAANG